jgi:hypothetical protein
MASARTLKTRKPCRRCLAAAASLVEASADSLFKWMETKPLQSRERRILSLRAGERYDDVVRLLRAAATK